MVFPGRFSTGCKRCKQRKVKCDEIRPSCRRCYIYGKPCPGYTDQFQFRIDLTKSNYKNSSDTKSSSSVTSSSSSAPSQPPQPPVAASTRRDETSESRRRRKVDSDRAVVLARSSSPAIAPHPDPSYDHVSLCYFVTRFVSPDRPDNFPGHLSFLPDIFNHYGNGPLELATLSVAQMAAYNQFGGDKFRMQSYQNHGRAVKALQKTIQSEDEVTDDRTIAAVLLLCIFKDIIGEGWGDPGEHASGLFYLLEKRGFEQIVTRRGAELFLLAFLRLQIHSFLRENDTYTNPGGLITFLGQFDPLLRAMSLMTTVLSLRHALSKDQVEGPLDDVKPDYDLSVSPTESEACTVQACYETLKEFDDWDVEAQSYWQSAYDDRTVPAGLGQVAVTAKNYDPETACTLILVRCARLVLLLSMLEYYERMRVLDGGDFGGAGREVIGAEFVPVLEQTVRSTIDDMLACVPHAIGDLDSSGQSTSMAYDGAGALVILQPLRLITYCPYATPEQTQMVQNVLHRMNELMGIKSATSWEDSATSTPKWAEPRKLRRAMALARVSQEMPPSPQDSVLSEGTAI